MAKKKTKIEGPSRLKVDKMYEFPMTPEERRKYNKLSMGPKTSQTMFTLPKGAQKLSDVEKKQMQARRTADRKRTLSRAAAIIRRDTGVKTVGPVAAKPKPKTKTTFG
jgi:hypothetical protein